MQGVMLRAPIMKFEEQLDGSLLVTGKMCTQDLDKQNEITDYEGAKRAAEKWSGNIREMHQLKAVGRAIDIMPNDAEKAIYIRGRISAGAADTILKIKDGTLADFSIGGSVNPNGRVAVRVGQAFATEYNVPADKIGKAVTILKDWDMAELSVVDSGANPNAKIEIVKTIGGFLTMTDVIAKGVLEEYVAGQEVIPNEAPETEVAPMEDEKTIVAHLVQARRCLESAAKLEVDELQENGSYCLDAITGCINAIREIEKLKVMQGAAEVASGGGASMATMVALANKITNVKKGMMTYKLDKKELKGLNEMIANLAALADSIKAFMTEHAAELAGEDVPPEAAEEAEAVAEETPAEEIPAEDAEKMATDEPAEKGCGKVVDTGAGERAEDEEAKPFTTKANVGRTVKKISAGSSDPVVKAVQGIMSSLENRLEEMSKRLARMEKEPVAGGPVRMSAAVEKTLHGNASTAVSEVDSAISAAFGSMSKSNRAPTESDLRFELAKQMIKNASMVK